MSREIVDPNLTVPPYLRLSTPMPYLQPIYDHWAYTFARAEREYGVRIKNNAAFDFYLWFINDFPSIEIALKLRTRAKIGAREQQTDIQVGFEDAFRAFLPDYLYRMSTYYFLNRAKQTHDVFDINEHNNEIIYGPAETYTLFDDIENSSPDDEKVDVATYSPDNMGLVYGEDAEGVRKLQITHFGDCILDFDPQRLPEYFHRARSIITWLNSHLELLNQSATQKDTYELAQLVTYTLYTPAGRYILQFRDGVPLKRDFAKKKSFGLKKRDIDELARLIRL